MDPLDIIDRLELQPHPEGGWFRETWREPANDRERPAGSAIYFLLVEGHESRLHRIDATEIWHYYAGAVVELFTSDSDGVESLELVGPDADDGQRPQAIVPPGIWQRARTTGPFTLVGCTVSPAFDWSSLEFR